MEAQVKFGQTPTDICSQERGKSKVLARQWMMLRLREMGLQLQEIGLRLGNRNHATVIHGIRTQAAREGDVKDYGPRTRKQSTST